jgi:fused signal recognition particle receptor
VISEKEIAEPLAELELVLLENDVALPVTEEIIAQVRSRLVGKRRKIGENVDILVISALRESLLEVLGEGFDLLSYIKSHEKPVKILFTGVNGTGKTTTVAKVGAFEKERVLGGHRGR